MTLPANDAFTLGLSGNHDSSTYPISLRSTATKISFVSGPKSPKLSPVAHRSVSRVSKRSGSESSARRVSAPAVSAVAERKENGVVPQKPSAAVPIDWEIPRKALHSSIGFVTLYLYVNHVSPRPILLALSTSLGVLIPVDFLRLRSPFFERTFESCVGVFMRDSEKKSSNGVIWYILGVLFVLAVYPLDVAVVSILILAWADTAASTIGRLWGSRTPPLPRRLPILGLPFAPRKSLAGFLAGSLTGASIIATFWGSAVRLGLAEPIWTWSNGPVGGWLGLGLISLVGGLASGVAEALDVGSWDDNLTLPIISGGCIWAFIKFLSIFSS